MADPPPFFRLLLAFLADRRFRREATADLQEEYEALFREEGGRAARRWYRRQVLRSVAPFLRWRVTKKSAAWRIGAKRVAWSTPGQDVKYALRSLTGAPGFSFVVILTFALGVGANTAAFSLVHSLVLDPLPFAGGDRMVQLWRYELYEGDRRALDPPVAPMVAAWEQAGIFEALGAYAEEEFHLDLGGGTVSVRGARVSPDLLQMVSAFPLRGRLLGMGDEIPGYGNVVLLSEGLWAGRFGGDPGVVDRTLSIDGTPHTVVGVIPDAVRQALESGFFGSQEKELFLPLVGDAAGGWAGRPNVVARMPPGSSVGRVQEQLDLIQPRVASLLDGESEWFPLVIPAAEALSHNLRRGIWVVLGALCLVLLIACANIAILLLVRRLARTEEMKVRLALGAGRVRLGGQLVWESMILGMVGMAVAALSARWLLDGAIWIGGGAIPELQAGRLDFEALGFGLMTGLLTIFVFSSIPLIHLRQLSPSGVLTRDRPERLHRPPGWAAYKALVVGQVAMATVLVLASGLLSQSLGRLLAVDPGFDTEGLAAVGLDLPRARYDVGAERLAFFDEVVRGLAGAPEVEAVGWARFVPPRVAGAPGRVEVEGAPPDQGGGNDVHAGNWVAPSYFRAVRSTFLEGRPFTDAEIADRAEVVILNRAGAQGLWPDGGGGVGSRIRLNSDLGPSPWMTVVGIVSDYKAWWLGDQPDRLQVYLPVSNVPPRSGVILIRGDGDLGALAQRVQTQVWRIDKNLPVGEAYWVGDAFNQSVARQRFEALLLSSFGVMGMLLAVLGVYGVLGLSVNRRIREMGVRLALGATRGSVIRKVLGQGAWAVGIGTALGLGVAYLFSHLLADLLWGVQARDPSTYLACAAAMVLAGLAATWVSTRRVTGIDPVDALKRE